MMCEQQPQNLSELYWRACKEEMPKEIIDEEGDSASEYVIGYIEKSNSTIIAWAVGGIWLTWDTSINPCEIVYWIPLPSPPVS